MNIPDDDLVKVFESARVLTDDLFVDKSPETTAFLCGRRNLGLELLNTLNDEQKHIILMRLLCPQKQ